MKLVIAVYYIDNSLVINMNYGYLKHETQPIVSELDNLINDKFKEIRTIESYFQSTY